MARFSPLISDYQTKLKQSARKVSVSGRSKTPGVKKTKAPKASNAAAAARSAPKPFQPMLATLIDGPFNDENFLFEIKYDGYRATAILHNNKAELYSRNLKSFTGKYPGITAALQKINETVILDGEVVAENKKGISEFQLLQNIENNGLAENVKYYVFDMLHLNGHDLFDMSLIDRKNLLKMLLGNYKKLKNIIYSEHTAGKGIAFYERARKKRLEGIIAKESNSLYYAGRRSGSWMKIKITQQQEFIIIGMTPPQGSRSYFGSLLLGYYKNGILKYAGNCGTGFTESSLKLLYDKAGKYFTKVAQVSEKVPVAGRVQWIKPKLVCQVKFTEWTKMGILRHPVYLGLRNDKKPKEISREKTVLHE